MKIVGALLIGCGLALIVFVGYQALKQSNKFISPVPDEHGVKVIFVTPEQ